MWPAFATWPVPTVLVTCCIFPSHRRILGDFLLFIRVFPLLWATASHNAECWPPPTRRGASQIKQGCLNCTLRERNEITKQRQRNMAKERAKKNKKTKRNIWVNKVCRSLSCLISHTCPFRTGAGEKVIKFKCAAWNADNRYKIQSWHNSLVKSDAVFFFFFSLLTVCWLGFT